MSQLLTQKGVLLLQQINLSLGLDLLLNLVCICVHDVVQWDPQLTPIEHPPSPAPPATPPMNSSEMVNCIQEGLKQEINKAMRNSR